MPPAVQYQSWNAHCDNDERRHIPNDKLMRVVDDTVGKHAVNAIKLASFRRCTACTTTINEDGA